MTIFWLFFIFSWGAPLNIEANESFSGCYVEGELNPPGDFLGVNTDRVHEDYDRWIEPCEIAERCKKNGRTKYWAQNQMSINQALRQLEVWGLANGNDAGTDFGLAKLGLKAAVVDSGFDQDVFGKEYPNISVKQGNGVAKPVNPDPTGHGTPVAGLVVGKNGMGAAPGVELTVYGVAHPRIRGEFITPNIALLKACKEGNTFINFSGAGDSSESGSAPLVDDETRKELDKRGCLIITASGNSGVKKRNNQHDTDEAPWVRVGATEEMQDETRFSTSAQLHAPGHGVFSLAGQNEIWRSHYREEQNPRLKKGFMSYIDPCDGTDEKSLQFGFTTGTSFSSPLVTGVFLMVEAVLRTYPRFKELPGVMKNLIRKSIVAASQRNGIVNANVAVHTAKFWVDRYDGKKPDPEKLQGQVRDFEKKKCEGKTRRRVRNQTCSEIPNSRCEKKKACYERKKVLTDLCDPPKEETLRDLYQTAIDGKNDETALGWMGRWVAQNPSANIPMADALFERYQKQWVKRGNTGQGWAMEEAFPILRRFINVTPKNAKGRKTLEKEISNFFTNRQFLEELGSKEGGARAEEMARLLEMLRLKFGERAVVDIIKGSGNYTTFPRVIARFMNHIGSQKANLDPDFVRMINQAETEVLPFFRKTEGAFKRDAEVYAKFFSRNKKWARHRFKATFMDSDKIYALGVPLVLAGLSDPSIVSADPKEQERFVLATLRLVERPPETSRRRSGWKYAQEEVVPLIREAAVRVSKSPAIRAETAELLRTTNDPIVIAEFADNGRPHYREFGISDSEFIKRSREFLVQFHSEQNKNKPPEKVLGADNEYFVSIAHHTGRLMGKTDLTPTELGQSYRSLHLAAQAYFKKQERSWRGESGRIYQNRASKAKWKLITKGEIAVEDEVQKMTPAEKDAFLAEVGTLPTFEWVEALVQDRESKGERVEDWLRLLQGQFQRNQEWLTKIKR